MRGEWAELLAEFAALLGNGQFYSRDLPVIEEPRMRGRSLRPAPRSSARLRPLVPRAEAVTSRIGCPHPTSVRCLVAYSKSDGIMLGSSRCCATPLGKRSYYPSSRASHLDVATVFPTESTLQLYLECMDEARFVESAFGKPARQPGKTWARLLTTCPARFLANFPLVRTSSLCCPKRTRLWGIFKDSAWSSRTLVC